MQPQQWVMLAVAIFLLAIGLLLILLGAGLTLWSFKQKTTHAGMMQDAATLLDKISNLFDKMGNYFGPDPAQRAGAFMMVLGVVLLVGAFVIFLIPGLSVMPLPAPPHASMRALPPYAASPLANMI